MTEDEARDLVTRLTGGHDPIALYPFEFGWVAKKTLPARAPGEPPSGRGLGMGSFVIDHNGVVTTHPSVPISVVMQTYATARREGRITGGRIWPVPDGTSPDPANPPT
jgi:hypothetical protein